jgi:hypothetical protein
MIDGRKCLVEFVRRDAVVDGEPAVTVKAPITPLGGLVLRVR